MKYEIVIGITGASSIIYAYELLAVLSSLEITIHLIISPNAYPVIYQEAPSFVFGTDPVNALKKYATYFYNSKDFSATISSGSYLYNAMVIIPCSMSTLAHVAHGTSNSLLHRVADVCLKERRPLVIIPRETPFSTLHLQNMLSLSQNGAIIMPPIPAFYHHPESILDIVHPFILRILDILTIKHSLSKRWAGIRNTTTE
ncbi:MAG: UbiX family flavin prenyltransferase [Desulfovibrionaceae bacterium]